MKTLKKLPQFILGDGKTARLEVNLADKRVPTVFYSAIGISLGIIAGIVLGIATLPAPRGVDSANPAPAPATAALPASQPSMQDPQKPALPTAVPSPAIPAAVPVVSEDKTIAAPSRSVTNPVSAAGVNPVSTRHPKVPGVLRVAVLEVSHRSSHRARGTIRVNQDLATILPADPSPAVQPSQNEQVADSGKPQKSSNFFVEGDLMVVDFDASAGKLETSDGRRFLLDSSGFDSAMNWSDDRLDVHYRCAQGGVCVLKGPGAASMSARQI